jgi:hypothetical protein
MQQCSCFGLRNPQFGASATEMFADGFWFMDNWNSTVVAGDVALEVNT